MANANAWLQGAYFYEAISVALSNAFSKSKITYRSTPYGAEQDYKEMPKQTILDNKLKARAMQIKALLEAQKNE